MVIPFPHMHGSAVSRFISFPLNVHSPCMDKQCFGPIMTSTGRFKLWPTTENSSEIVDVTFEVGLNCQQ